MDPRKIEAYCESEHHWSANDAAQCSRMLFDSRTGSNLQFEFLTSCQRKGLKAIELCGLVIGLQDLCQPMPLELLPPCQLLVSGTGGDGQGLFNVTTLAAIIAGAVPEMAIIKTGGQKTTSKSGSVDVMRHLGINPPRTTEQVTECVNRFGLALVPSDVYCPALGNIREARSRITGPTAINMIAPMLNPFGLKRFACGAWSNNTASIMASAAKLLGFKKAFFYCGENKIDEISPCGESLVRKVNENKSIVQDKISPNDFNAHYWPKLGDFKISDPAQSALVIRDVLDGGQTCYRLPAIINAAMLLYASGKTTELDDAAEMANEAIVSGQALRNLEQMIEFMK